MNAVAKKSISAVKPTAKGAAKAAKLTKAQERLESIKSRHVNDAVRAGFAQDRTAITSASVLENATETTAEDFKAGIMVSRLWPDLTKPTDKVYREALRIMGLPGYESKGDGEKRSEEQEKAYGTARTALSRFRAKGGAVAGEKDTRGGANGGGRKPQAGGKGKKSNVVELPKKWTPEKFEQFYTGMAALMVATYQKVVSQKISVPGLTEYGAAAAEFQRRVAGITKG